MTELSPPTDRDRHRTFYVAWAAVGVFVLLAGYAAVKSRGFLEADGCTHYLYARHAFEQKFYLVDVWGRPFKTILYALPAHWFGLFGVRFLSIAVAALTAWLTFVIARGQGYRRPELAIILLLGQPLFFVHGFSELTELPFAALAAGALLAYQRRGFAEFALLVGLMPLSRPEGFGMLAPAVVALVLHRRAYFLPILFVPLIAWNHAGWVMWGRQGEWIRWLPDNWPYAGDSVYAAGNLFKFAALLPVLTSPMVLPFMWLGMARSLRPQAIGLHASAEHVDTGAPPPPAREVLDYSALASRGTMPDALRILLNDHRARVQFLIAALPLGLLVGHSLLHALGKMASNGELRYLLCLAPLWALCAAAGWEWTAERYRIPARTLLASVAVLLPIGVNIYYPVIPLKFDTNWDDAEVVAATLKADLAHDPKLKIMVSHPGVFYFLDMSINDPDHALDWRRDLILSRPPGTVLVWDDVYGRYNASRDKSMNGFDEILAAGWRERPIAGLQQPERWKMFVSE